MEPTQNTQQAVAVRNTNYNALMDYLRTNVLLDEQDVQMFAAQFQNLVDGVFTIALNQEKGFLEEEIKEISKLLSTEEYANNEEAKNILNTYQNRLAQISQLITTLNTIQQ